MKAPALDRLPDGVLLRAMLLAALDAVEPARATARVLATRHPRRSIHVLAMGKASVPMASAAMDWAGEHLAAAVAVTKHAPSSVPAGLEILEAAHPVPDVRSIRAGEAVQTMVAGLGPDDELLVLLSGGASSLVVLPAPGVTLEDLASRTRHLMEAGAPIETLNAMRRETDRIKGGGLARLAARTHVRGLVLSDVMGDDPAVIGSGPLTGPGVNVPVRIVANNQTAVDAAAAVAEQAGRTVSSWPVQIRGEARALAPTLVEHLRARSEPGLWLGGGETTVTVTGDGTGGRNTELALAACLALDGGPPAALVTLATDGEDGSSPAAGAVVDHETATRARAVGVDLPAALERNDSHGALERLDALIVTGPTGTNVCDLVVGVTW